MRPRQLLATGEDYYLPAVAFLGQTCIFFMSMNPGMTDFVKRITIPPLLQHPFLLGQVLSFMIGNGYRSIPRSIFLSIHIKSQPILNFMRPNYKQIPKRKSWELLIERYIFLCLREKIQLSRRNLF